MHLVASFGPIPDSNRRKFIQKAPSLTTTGGGIIVAVTVTVTTILSNPDKAWSRNLPESTGADLSATGTITKLIPIVRIRSSLTKAQEILETQVQNPSDVDPSLLSSSSSSSSSSSLDKSIIANVMANLASIPNDEKQFKQIFDEYSDPVSYKQKYMDSNAFLVYYTKGYDGPGRDSIEKDIPKQTLQYGARNDAWNSYDELMVEIKFADSNTSIKDILIPLNGMLKNIDVYLSLAPKDDVEKAYGLLL